MQNYTNIIEDLEKQELMEDDYYKYPISNEADDDINDSNEEILGNNN
jgi:hypothetical protein